MFAHKFRADAELRILEQSHAEELFALIDRNRSYLTEWLPWPDKNRSIEDTREFIASVSRQMSENKGFAAGIWAEGRLAGVIGYHPVDWDNRSVSLGYWLAEPFQGRGLMTEACRALVHYAFREWKLNRVEIRCGVGNVRSRAIPERLGFKEEGVLRQAQWVNGRFVDLAVYSILAQEWPR